MTIDHPEHLVSLVVLAALGSMKDLQGTGGSQRLIVHFDASYQLGQQKRRPDGVQSLPYPVLRSLVFECSGVFSFSSFVRKLKNEGVGRQQGRRETKEK